MNLKKLSIIILLVATLSLLSIVPVNAAVKNVAFDSEYYANSYADIKAAFGNDADAAYNHFVNIGIKEGRVASPVFDVVTYVLYYPDLQAAFGTDYAAAYNHFISTGVNEGRLGSAEFNVNAYLANYPDLKEAFGTDYAAAFDHFVNVGVNEGRIADVLVPGATAPEEHVHEFTVVSEYVVEPTCKDDGSAIYECAICGEKETEARIVKASEEYHDWIEDDEALVPPTCIKNGKAVYECSVCGENKEEILLADEKYHDWGTDPVVTKGSPDFAGYEVYQCEVCGKYKTSEYNCKHDYKLAYTTATCESSGENIYICSKCQDEKREYVAKLGHDIDLEVEDNIETPATCYTDGLAKGTCRRVGCGKEDATMVIPAAHKWAENAVEKEATCTEPGEIHKACTVCGTTINETIPATGHIKPETVKYYPVEAKIDLDKNGNEVYVKDTDGNIEYKTEALKTALASEDKPAEIKLNNTSVVNKTLCEYGIAEVYTCSDCGETAIEIYSDIVGHNYKVTKQAKCTTTGTEVCSVCKATKVIPATGHSLVGVSLVPVSETESENAYTVRCKSCGQFTIEDITADGVLDSALSTWIKGVKDSQGPATGTITFSDNDVWNVKVTYKQVEENYAVDTITIVDKAKNASFVLPKYESVKDLVDEDLTDFDKKLEDLQNDVEVSGDGTISGTLGCVESFDAFPGVEDGHFLVLYLGDITEDETITVKVYDGDVGSPSRTKELNKDDKTLIVQIKDNTKKIEFVSSNGTVTTLKIGDDLVLAAKA